MERTFVMLKPDAVQRGLVGEIVNRFERRGLKIVAMKMVHVTTEFAHQHYAVHVGKPFFEGLIKYITERAGGGDGVGRDQRDRRGARHDGRDEPCQGRAGHDPGRLQPGDGTQPGARIRRAGDGRH